MRLCRRALRPVCTAGTGSSKFAHAHNTTYRSLHVICVSSLKRYVGVRVAVAHRSLVDIIKFVCESNLHGQRLPAIDGASLYLCTKSCKFVLCVF